MQPQDVLLVVLFIKHFKGNMADLILYIVWMLSDTMSERYPLGFRKPWGSADNFTMEDGVFHFNLYLGYGLLVDCLVLLGCMFSKWALFGLLIHLGMIAQIFYRECIEDKHLARRKAGTENRLQWLDFKADLITRLSGMIAPILMALVIIILAFV